MPKISARKKILILLIVLLLLYTGYKGARLVYGIKKWNVSSWAYGYLFSGPSRETVPDDQKHLVFFMVDHYEHGVRPDAAERNRAWCEKFRVISDRNLDDYGNRFRYTWFYPYDQHVDEIMSDLSEMAFRGYGEVEFHWHIPLASEKVYTPENFPEKLAEAVQWYQRFGAMITEEEQPRAAFAYVAGNWDMDASRRPESNGLTNHIEALLANGCFADFTYSTIGTYCQPRKINSIYYVKDDPKRSKDHDTGTDVEVGKPVEGQFMIFQGPMTVNWNGDFEYGAVETDPRFAPDRIPRWFEANVHVKGRPEWVFVKVYSHGAQSRKIVLENDMELMLQSLKKYCVDRRIKLHFVCAREAYNIAKAAEAGKTGNPEDYRDFAVPKYQNMVKSFLSKEKTEDRESTVDETKDEAQP